MSFSSLIRTGDLVGADFCYHEIPEKLEELKKDLTIVIVTHNMQQAARISDQTVFFYQGRIVEYGETKDIFTNPENKQTEEYITGRFS